MDDARVRPITRDELIADYMISNAREGMSRLELAELSVWAEEFANKILNKDA